jgi:glutamine amidotransferase-like uncharacterized protein
MFSASKQGPYLSTFSIDSQTKAESEEHNVIFFFYGYNHGMFFLDAEKFSSKYFTTSMTMCFVG